MAPDFERLARTPWPMACCASSGIRFLSSALACSCCRPDPNRRDAYADQPLADYCAELRRIVGGSGDGWHSGTYAIHSKTRSS
jgi:hypothetical protein